MNYGLGKSLFLVTFVQIVIYGISEVKVNMLKSHAHLSSKTKSSWVLVIRDQTM